MSKPLTDRPKKELADLARRRGVPKWDALSKEQLVKVLSKPAPKPAARITTKPTKPAAKSKPAPKPAPTRPAAAKPPAKPAAVPVKPTPKPAPVAEKMTPAPIKPVLPVAAKPAPLPKPTPKPAAKVPESTIPADKDLSTKNSKNGQPVKDRIHLFVPDPYWLHAAWELSLQSVQRAEAALGQDWYGAKPIIRLFDVTSQDTTSTAEAPIRDINIHGGCNHWYIDVPQPPRSYRADIGYITRRGVFHPLCRSNVVTPPKAGVSEAIDGNWVEEIDEKAAERLLAMSTGFESATGPSQLRELFDEQLKRTGKDAAFGSGAVLPDKLKKFAFTIDAELIVYGKTDPTAHVTLQNDPVKLRPDGTFVHRYKLTDGRQIIPAVAAASDGMEERTIVLAVERNTKYLDPMVHDLYGEN